MKKKENKSFVVVTVGSTQFDILIESIDNEEILKIIQKKKKMDFPEFIFNLEEAIINRKISNQRIISRFYPLISNRI